MSFFRKANNDTAATGNDICEERRYLVWRNNDFFLREAFKTLRTNVMFSMAGQKGCCVITLTSSLKGEGKSSTAANLAMTFAETGSRTLLVDCDLRKPTVSRLLDISAPIGLTDVLVDHRQLKSALIQLHKKKPLWVLSSGRIPPNPSELLNSESMRLLMMELKNRFDYIVFDTPPIGLVTDAVVLAPLTDGFLVVVRAEKSDRRAVAYCVSQLEYANAKILGTVFVGSHPGGGYGYRRYGSGKYGYGKYGYGRYRYGEEDE